MFNAYTFSKFGFSPLPQAYLATLVPKEDFTKVGVDHQPEEKKREEKPLGNSETPTDL